MTTILVVEDERAVRDMLRFAFDGEEAELLEAEDAAQGFAQIARRAPDLILLDWMLPGMSGLEFVRRLKKDAARRAIPVIMLTARGAEGDKVGALGAGVDDYVTKPFSIRELKARIAAVLRRARPGAEPSGVVRAGRLTLDPAAYEVRAGGAPLALGPTEFRLLRFLMERPGRAYTRAQLLDGVWGPDACVEERTVDVHVRRLRRALARCACERYVQTVRTVGYRFSAGEAG